MKKTIVLFSILVLLNSSFVSADDKVLNIPANTEVETTTTTFNNRIDVPTLLFDPVVVDKSNYKQTVIADGLMKEEDLLK